MGIAEYEMIFSLVLTTLGEIIKLIEGLKNGTIDPKNFDATALNARISVMQDMLKSAKDSQ